MKIPGMKAIHRSRSWLISRFVNGALILGYHRIQDADSDPFNVCVSPKHFSQHLEVISSFARTARLGKLVEDLGSGGIRHRTVVITFDDGYADFARNAIPLLEKYGVPTTLFISTGVLGGQFWWEELRQIVYSPQRLPRVLSIRLNGDEFTWMTGHEEADEVSGSVRQDLLRGLYQKMLPLAAPERESALADLRDWSGWIPDEQSSAALTQDDVFELSKNHLVELGAHSVTHPALAAMSHSVQSWEISESKRQLEDLTGRAVTAFSYPNGSWSSDVERRVREAGFSSACGSQFDLVWKRSNRYHLPRFWAKNRDGEWLARRLHRWLRAK